MEERDRPVKEPDLHGVNANEINGLVEMSINGQLNPEEEMDLRIQLLSLVLNFIDVEDKVA